MALKRDQILAELPRIPRLPTAAIEVLRTLQDPETGLDAVIPVLSHDPGLTAETLRVANSAAYLTRNPCTSLREAVVRLGKDRIRMVLLHSGLGPAAQREIKGYGLGPGQLLEHSMLVARGVPKLAKLLKIEAPAAGFTAGLLHNLGKLVLGTFLEVDGGAIYHLAKNEGLAFDEAEQQFLGIDHAEVGALLLEGWGIPQEIVDAVRWHHRPEYALEPRASARLIHLTDHVCVSAGIGAGLDGAHYPPCSETIEALQFNLKVAQELTAELVSDRKPIGSMFGFAKPEELDVQVVDPSREPSPAAPRKSPVMQRVLGFIGDAKR